MNTEISNQITENSSSEHGVTRSSWPYKIKLTTDSVRWDSLKIPPSREFEQCILHKMSAASRKALEKWQPVEISLYDVETCENYKVQFAKKESFWFEPLPDIGHRKQISACSNASMIRNSANKSNYAYCLQPFRHIVKTRGLRYDEEIGLNWSGSRIEFSVLQGPKFGFKI